MCTHGAPGCVCYCPPHDVRLLAVCWGSNWNAAMSKRLLLLLLTLLFGCTVILWNQLGGYWVGVAAI